MRRLFLAVLILPVLASPALAQEAAPAQDPSAAPEPLPPAKPEPQRATAELALVQGAYGVSGRTVALAGQTITVRGDTSRFVEGQEFVVRAYRGSRKLAAVTAKLKPVADGARGRFVVRLRLRGRGSVTIRASHARTDGLDTVTARPRRVLVVSGDLGPGARGPAVRLAQRLLDRLRFAVPRTGVLDDGTARALIAYRKNSGMPRTARLSTTILRRLAAGKGGFPVRYPGYGRHVEADLSKQVLALINPGGKVHRIYHTASGAPATPTVIGTFRFYMKSPGTNAKGMVHSSYFIRGYAIHGYASVPTGPASHGCLRVPIPNARTIFDWIHVGDRIAVYR